MQRILIIGSGGAGKSTLAVRLGQKLALPVVHLDRLYWVGNWQHLDRPAFRAVLEAELEKPAFIMDGNFDYTLPLRLSRCDTVLYLDYPTIVCLWGAVRRVVRYHGKTRPDMGGECKERFDPDFFRWVLHFRQKEAPRLAAALDKAGPQVNILRFTSRRQVERYLQKI